MNEKIKQLALDAGIGFTLWDDSGREMIDNYTPEEYLEKFAELIVRECIGKYDEWAEHSTDKTSFAMARHNVKKHFGIKE